MSIDPGHPLYPMRVVLRRTGLTPDLLRAWERRYGVVTPGRTQGGQRLYSEADVERLTLLRRATLYGHAISQVAALANEELERVLLEAPVTEVPSAPGARRDQADVVAECLEAVKWMDGAALDARLRQAAMSLGPVRFSEEVVAPLVTEVGLLWHQGQLRIVQEHLATSLIRQVVGGLMSFARAGSDGRILVAATTSGQRHEVGAMLAAAVAVSCGWQAVYLGPDLSGDEIAEAVDRVGADAVALSLVFPVDDPAIDADLTALVKGVQRRTAIYVGGPAAAHRRQLLDRLGIDYLALISDLAGRLDKPPLAAAS